MPITKAATFAMVSAPQRKKRPQAVMLRALIASQLAKGNLPMTMLMMRMLTNQGAFGGKGGGNQSSPPANDADASGLFDDGDQAFHEDRAAEKKEAEKTSSSAEKKKGK